MKDRKRTRRTATEKLRLVVAGMDTSVNIAEMCRREGIAVTQFYGWKKKLLSSATEVFEDKSKKKSRQEEKLEEENRRLKEVIAEITSENLELKKGLSD